MNRFLILVGVAVVAAGMYVAASPASQQSKGPTLKQFNALQKQVTALSKKLKTTKDEADAAFGVIGACYLNSSANFEDLKVSQRGTINPLGPGYLFGTNGTTNAPTTALDIATSSPPQAYLQEIDPQCIAILGGLRHHAGSSQLQRWADRLR
jgi:hypothetical protein